MITFVCLHTCHTIMWRSEEYVRAGSLSSSDSHPCFADHSFMRCICLPPWGGAWEGGAACALLWSQAPCLPQWLCCCCWSSLSHLCPLAFLSSPFLSSGTRGLGSELLISSQTQTDTLNYLLVESQTDLWGPVCLWGPGLIHCTWELESESEQLSSHVWGKVRHTLIEDKQAEILEPCRQTWVRKWRLAHL